MSNIHVYFSPDKLEKMKRFCDCTCSNPPNAIRLFLYTYRHFKPSKKEIVAFKNAYYQNKHIVQVLLKDTLQNYFKPDFFISRTDYLSYIVHYAIEQLEDIPICEAGKVHRTSIMLCKELRNSLKELSIRTGIQMTTLINFAISKHVGDQITLFEIIEEPKIQVGFTLSYTNLKQLDTLVKETEYKFNYLVESKIRVFLNEL